MAPHRTRQETAAALHRAPAPAPVDDAFIAVLANLASTSVVPDTRSLQTRVGLRIAAAVSAVAMVTAGSAYAAHQLGEDPAPAPMPAHETDAPDQNTGESTGTPLRSTAVARDQAPRKGDAASGEHTARHGGDGGADETHAESVGGAGSGPESEGSNVVTGHSHDDEGDEDQGSTEPDDHGDNQDDQGEDADDQGDGADDWGDQDDDDQGDSTDDENDTVQDGDSDAADDDQDQHTERPGDDRDPADGEVTGNDDNS